MNYGVIFANELLGTMLLIILGNGVVSNIVLKKTKGENAGFLAISLGWGTAVFLAAVLSGLSGGAAYFNPAVTLGFVSAKAFPYESWMIWVFFAAQMVGAILGQIVIDTFYYQNIKETIKGKDKADAQGRVLGMHSTGPTHRKPWYFNFFGEFVGTAVLITSIFITVWYNVPMITGFAIVGFTIFGIGISLGGTTGYAINPARDLGPRIVHHFLPLKGKGSSDWSYSWIPVFAPLLAGAVVGLSFMGAL